MTERTERSPGDFETRAAHDDRGRTPEAGSRPRAKIAAPGMPETSPAAEAIERATAVVGQDDGKRR